MAITRDEYIELRKKGLSKEQILELDRVAKSDGGEKALRSLGKVTDTVFGGGKVGSLIGSGIAKGEFGGKTFGPQIRKFITGVDLPKGAEQFVDRPKGREVVGSALRSASLFTPTGKIASSITPAFRGVGMVPRAAEGFGKIAAGAATGFGFDIASDLEKGKSIGEALTPGAGTAFGAAIPAAGEVFGLAKRLIGGSLKSTGEGIQKTVIKPSARDISDGFKAENIAKYEVGGSLQQMLNKTDDKIDDLSRQLERVMEEADDVNLNEVYKATVNELSKNKTSSIGSLRTMGKQLEGLQEEINILTDGAGVVRAPEAQQVKRAAGLFGAWKFGAPDPDSNAQEIVYTTFYRKLKEALEKVGGEDVQVINKQLSELIPIQHAIIRRIPVAQRNQALGLGDIITLSASTVEPSAFLLTVGNRAAKSGRVGDFLTNLGNELLKQGVRPEAITKAIQAVERGVLSGVTNQSR